MYYKDMIKIKRSNIVPSLVKHVEITSAYPGYKYVYFSSFKELDEYFKENYGENWLDSDWAQFWLRDYWRQVKRDKRPVVGAVKKLRQYAKEHKIPKHIIHSFITYYRDNENLSLRELSKALKEQHGIDINYSTIAKLIKREGTSEHDSE